MTRYDLTETTDFLNNSVPLSDLYEDVLDTMDALSLPCRYIDRDIISKVWITLMECADFIDTIQIKRGKP